MKKIIKSILLVIVSICFIIGGSICVGASTITSNGTLNSSVDFTTPTGSFDFGSIKVNFVTVTYETTENGVLNGDTTELILKNGSPENPPTPVPNLGYEFSGWKYGILIFEDVSNFSFSEDATLTAQYSPIELQRIPNEVSFFFQVTYYPNIYGTLSGDTEEAVKSGDSPKLSPTVVPNDGWVFIGWNNGEETKENASDFIITGNTSLVAMYEPVIEVTNVTVTYATDDQGAIEGVNTEEIEKGSSPQATPTVIPNEGIVFLGWTDGNGVYQDLSAYIVESDMTFNALYATVEPAEPVEPADGNDNNSNNNDEETVASYAIVYGIGQYGTTSDLVLESVEEGKVAVNVPEVTPLDGYEFLGWSVDGENLVDVSHYMITEDTIFEAVYKEAEVVTATPNENDSVEKTDENDIIPVGRGENSGPNWLVIGLVGIIVSGIGVVSYLLLKKDPEEILDDDTFDE